MPEINLSRRNFLIASAVIGSGLTLYFSHSNQQLKIFQPHADSDSFPESDSWLHINKENQVILKIPSSEMGQGIHTGIAMIVAEELDADWQNIKIQQAPLAEAFNNPEFGFQITGGSTSIQSFWQPLRTMAATARSMLIQAAANHWQVPAQSILTADSQLSSHNKYQASYAEFVELAAALAIPENVTLKSRHEFKLIGQSVKRLDTAAKIRGQARFGIDVNQPDMLIAAIRHPPVFTSRIKQIDKSKALSMKGVINVIEIDQASIAVVAKDYWTANQGLQALTIDYDIPEELSQSNQIETQFRQALDTLDKAQFSTNDNSLDLEYQVPFLAHVTMEPMNCSAYVQPHRCDIWAPTQGQSPAADVAEKITGLSREQIFIHTTYIGGGFGRRSESDFVAEAVELSKHLKKPVKVIWSREEDIQHDFYRPACLSRIQIKLNPSGLPEAWHHQFAAPSIFKRIVANKTTDWLPVTQIIGDPISQEGATPPYLSDQNQLQIQYEIVDTPVPVGFWRSVAHSFHAYFVESAIDEAAHKVAMDPYAYRLKCLQKQPRLKHVLKQAALLSNWGQSNYHQGIAVHHSFNSYVSQVIELSLDEDKGITIHRIVCVIDCGIVINPDSVIAQMQGAIVDGLSATFYGEINIQDGKVIQSNFYDYPILRLQQCPEIEVHLVESEHAPTGVGEPGLPPVAPALCNAIFAANGDRIRRLPLFSSGYQLSS